LSNFKSDYTVQASFTSEVSSGRLTFNPSQTTLAVTLAPFFVGPKGDSGSAASLSRDANNQLSLGQDGGLFMSGPSLETAQW
jgi:hypothetical protein